jgi:phosphoglycolate phosphatase
MKLILFDCDGTLVDSQHNIIEAMRRAFADVNLPFPGEAATRAIIGLSLHAAMQALAPDASPDVLRRLEEAYKDNFFRLRHEPDFHEPLFPGVREALDALAARDDVLLGIATGKSRRGLDKVLDESGLGELFAITRCADETISKPHPQMLEEILADLDMPPERAVMVGDTEFDLLMAANAGTGGLSPIMATDAASWDEIMQTNLNGTFYTVKHAGRAMAKSGGGAICAISSIAGVRTHRFMAPYCVSKAGIDHTTVVVIYDNGAYIEASRLFWVMELIPSKAHQ